MNAHRVFLSYSRQDGAIVAQLAGVLAAGGVDALWDRDLKAGLPFNDQIKAYIEHAHVFAPVISRASAESVWVHAEIGYALALRIPVLPIWVGGDPPGGMIQSVQAVSLKESPVNEEAFLEEATSKLTAAEIARVVKDADDRPALFECTMDNARRAELLASYARRVIAIERHGLVRQKASLGSFHLPNRPSTDRIWELYFGRPVRENLYLHDQLLAERRSLAEHARSEGCRLIIDAPEHYERIYGRYGPESARARARGLLAFLEGTEVPDVQVAVNDDPERKCSVTLVGDWFFSEAISSGEVANLREAIFTRSAAAVRAQIEAFDGEFERLQAVRAWNAEDSRNEVAKLLRTFLEESST